MMEGINANWNITNIPPLFVGKRKRNQDHRRGWVAIEPVAEVKPEEMSVQRLWTI